MSKHWINLGGEHINLAAATSIEEIGPQGTGGYKINHGSRWTQFVVIKEAEANTSAKTEDRGRQVRLAAKIRLYLYDNQIPEGY